MNIYTRWHGSAKFPTQLFMRCVQAHHLSWLFPVEQLCGSRRQSTHTRPHFAPFHISADSVPRLLQNNARAAKADFTPALLQGRQQYAALTASFAGWVSPTHSSASPSLLHEARGLFFSLSLTSLKVSPRLRPQRQSLRALYSLCRFVHVANTPFFWCQSSISERAGSAAEGQAVKHRRCSPGAPACYSVLQEKKIFCYCYFS